MATIAQQYLLLLLDDESGKPLITGSYLKYGLAGAVLADLALAERIELTGKRGMFSQGTVIVRNPDPVGDPVADTTLRELAADKPRPPQALVTRIAADVRPRVLDQLVDAGIVRREEGRVLGIFPRETWPATSTRLEQETRDGLRRVLVAGRPPEPQQTALIALLSATGALAKALPGEERRVLRARAKEVAQGQWASQAVKDVIDSAIAAVTAVTAATTAGS